MNLLLIANPENRRCAFYKNAADFFGHTLTVHSYTDWLAGSTPDPSKFDLTKIDSPGENFGVERQLAAIGSPDDSEQILAQPEDVGRVRWLSEWYRGFSHLLNRLPNDARYTIAPDDILTMFDKQKTNALLSTTLNVPTTLPAPISFLSLEAAVRREKWFRIFLKPRYASSASGVMAMTFAPDGVRAVTSMEIDDGRFYNSLRVRTYAEKDDVVRLSQHILEQGAVVERWVPKAGFENRTFDLRIVVIHGHPNHVVARSSTTPMTNLHLGNTRADIVRLRSHLGDTVFENALNTARLAASAFPNSDIVSADVAINASLKKAYVLEVNAFGDLLPGIEHSGMDTYHALLHGYTD